MSGGGGPSLGDKINTTIENTKKGASIGDSINTFLGVDGGSLGDAINRGNPKLESNLNNVGGEISGANHQRQEDWQKRVASDAAAAQATDIKNRQTASYNNAVTASNTAQSLQTQMTQRLSGQYGIMNWSAPNSRDTTDFLGL